MFVCKTHNQCGENKSDKVAPGRAKERSDPGDPVMKYRKANRAEQDIDRDRDHGSPLHYRSREQDKKGLQRERDRNKRQGDPAAKRDETDEGGRIRNYPGPLNIPKHRQP